MSHLWIPDIPISEKILRSVIIYLFILLAFRFTGKRQVGQLTPFDLVVLLIISNVVQNAVIGNDNSLGGGLLGAVTILALNYLIVELTFRFKPFRRIMEGEPTLLVHNGKVLRDSMHREKISMDDLEAAMRRSGVASVERVHFAVLEENGQISVIPKN
ncbi:MAG TPA: YetF domain-containing protein [bacterium]